MSPDKSSHTRIRSSAHFFLGGGAFIQPPGCTREKNFPPSEKPHHGPGHTCMYLIRKGRESVTQYGKQSMLQSQTCGLELLLWGEEGFFPYILRVGNDQECTNRGGSILPGETRTVCTLHVPSVIISHSLDRGILHVYHSRVGRSISYQRMGTVIVFTAKYIYFPVTWLFLLKKKGSLSCTKHTLNSPIHMELYLPSWWSLREKKESSSHYLPIKFLPLSSTVSLPCWGQNYKTNGQLRKGQGQETITCRTKQKKRTRKIAEKIHRHKNKKRKGKKQRE